MSLQIDSSCSDSQGMFKLNEPENIGEIVQIWERVQIYILSIAPSYF